MRIGVIGTGVMGENHVRAYTSLSDHCHLVGIYDVDGLKANEIAKRYQIKSFESLEELLQNVDAVSIAVPTEYHYEIGLTCIAHKVHVLMEKPITRTIAQAKDLIKKAEKAGVKLQVGHIELFNPTIEVLKKILVDEEIIAVDVHRMGPFHPRLLNLDVVEDLMIHDIYILYHLLNSKIEHFYALGRPYENTMKHAMVISKFKNGIIAQITASFKSEEKIRSLRFITKKAFIQANLLKKEISIYRSADFVNKLPKHYKQQNIIEKIIVPEKDSLKMELINFINCIKNDLEPTTTGEDGLIALATINKIINHINNKYTN
ncbi:Gfo/Idh/MocA family oxidoreductase [Metabacillus sp. Hm71]|uniref:Gfo/Idh/MocA family oxidoreductase n=1 Tax=Metabacillus sp. Hm71 TaxID=3450743 RepID=UPI003F4201BD